MSQNFKLKYDKMRESNPTHPEQPQETPSKAFEEFYTEESNARNICFVWMDGRRIFMNYSYLVSGQYLPEENMIILTFTTQVFILKGIHLETLFYDIMRYASKQIVCMDTRYNLIDENDRSVVNQIQTKKAE